MATKRPEPASVLIYRPTELLLATRWKSFRDDVYACKGICMCGHLASSAVSPFPGTIEIRALPISMNHGPLNLHPGGVRGRGAGRGRVLFLSDAKLRVEFFPSDPRPIRERSRPIRLFFPSPPPRASVFYAVHRLVKNVLPSRGHATRIHFPRLKKASDPAYKKLGETGGGGGSASP